jgi:hypothetical protein
MSNITITEAHRIATRLKTELEELKEEANASAKISIWAENVDILSQVQDFQQKVDNVLNIIQLKYDLRATIDAANSGARAQGTASTVSACLNAKARNKEQKDWLESFTSRAVDETTDEVVSFKILAAREQYKQSSYASDSVTVSLLTAEWMQQVKSKIKALTREQEWLSDALTSCNALPAISLSEQIKGELNKLGVLT